VATHCNLAGRRARFRVRALLAGALVLGVGATTTLASWTDSESATGSFTTSVFDTESSTTAGVWVDNLGVPGATLAFDATAMSPAVSFYAWLNVRTTAASTVGGTVTLTGATAAGTLAPVLEYRTVRTPASGTTCDAAAFSGTPTWIAGAASAYLAATAVPDTAIASAITSPSGELRYCFDVRVQSGADSSYQGTAATVTWSLTANSD
jgi:predicted ribosomally synthesized peptide with SipW-like signal peptide